MCVPQGIQKSDFVNQNTFYDIKHEKLYEIT